MREPKGLEKVHKQVVCGTLEESYAKLPLWSAILESNNLGSFTSIETNTNNRFQNFFMSIGASIQGFQHMYLVVAVDGTLLNNRCGGILYAASCLDANKQIYPLAFDTGLVRIKHIFMVLFQYLRRHKETALI